MLVNRHKRHKRRRGVLAFAGHRVFRIHLHSHLHGRMEDSVHLRMQHHYFAKIYGISKINVVHRRRDDIPVRMPVRRQRCRHVHQMHYLPAQQLPQRIRLRRQNDFCHLRSRRAHRLSRQLGFRALPHSYLSLHSFLHFSRTTIFPTFLPALLPFFVPLCVLCVLCVLRGLCVNSLLCSSLCALCALCAPRPLC